LSDAPEQIDVVIVGAGPAGLAAAGALLEGGRRVMVVDARHTVGSPLRCGEVARARLFDELGVAPRREWVRQELDAPLGMAVIDRPRVEADVVRLLGERGALIRTGTTVTGVGPCARGERRVQLRSGAARHEVRARLVIAADGVASHVARMAGIDTRLRLDQVVSCLAWRVVETRISEPRKVVLDYLPELRPNYFWVIPSGEGQANVGLGVPGHRGHLLPTLLEHHAARSRHHSGGQLREVIAGAYPSTKPLARPYADSLMVVGTAARLVNALTGEGIWQAAHSGRAAALTYLEAGSAAEARLAGYRRRLDPLYRELHRSLELKRKLTPRGPS